MARIIFVCLFILVNLVSAQNLNHGEGILKIYFSNFPYVNDPAGRDYRSYKQLGDLRSFTLRIIPKYKLKEIRESQIAFSKAVPGMKRFTIGEEIIKGIMTPRSAAANAAMSKGSKDEIIKVLRSNQGIGFNWNSKLLPHHFLIPIPAGSYYLEYSLEFKYSSMFKTRFFHPNYKSKSASVAWGPSLIVISDNQTLEVNFRPTTNIAGYEYIKDDFSYFQESDAFWDFLDYLVWLGEL